MKVAVQGKKKTRLTFGLVVGVLLGILFMLACFALFSVVVINCLNYLFPVLQIPVDFWGIFSMMVLLIVLNNRKIMLYGKKEDV